MEKKEAPPGSQTAGLLIARKILLSKAKSIFGDLVRPWLLMSQCATNQSKARDSRRPMSRWQIFPEVRDWVHALPILSC